MDMSSLKNSVESIKMPEAMRQRITKNSKKILMEDRNMDKAGNWFRRPVIVAAMLVLCICLPIAGVAAGNSGFFRDVMRGTAVVGTEYEQATAEIAVDADFDNGELTVTANFLIPNAAPYRECEELAVGSYRIMTGNGKIVAEGGKSENAAMINGHAVMRIPAEALSPGDYTLQIDAFIGSKKADQPLPLKGNWENEFTVR